MKHSLKESQNEMLRKDIDIEALKTVSISGLDSYHLTTRLSRLSYAKPDVSAEKINVNGSALIKQIVNCSDRDVK